MRFSPSSSKNRNKKALVFPYKDPKDGTAFVLEYFENIMQDPDIRKV